MPVRRVVPNCFAILITDLAAIEGDDHLKGNHTIKTTTAICMRIILRSWPCSRFPDKPIYRLHRWAAVVPTQYFPECIGYGVTFARSAPDEHHIVNWIDTRMGRIHFRFERFAIVTIGVTLFEYIQSTVLPPAEMLDHGLHLGQVGFEPFPLFNVIAFGKVLTHISGPFDEPDEQVFFPLFGRQSTGTGQTLSQVEQVRDFSINIKDGLEASRLCF